MERINNRGGLPVAATGGTLVLVLASQLWFPENIEPSVTLALMCGWALLLVIFCARREYRANLSRLQTLEGESQRLECDHNQLQRRFMQQSDALHASCREYQELVESANSIIIRWDTDGTIRYANRYALDFFGYSREEFIGKGVLDTIVPAKESTGRDLSAMIEDISTHPERYVSNENENICRNQRRVWVSWTNKAVRNERGDTIEVLSVGNDITDKKRFERKIYQLAHYDHLTGLPNRNHLAQCLSDTITRAGQEGQHFSVLYIGLDRFKPVNDSLGQDRGDLLLQILGERMRLAADDDAAVARMSGDEFCVVLARHDQPSLAMQSAQQAAQNLLESINRAAVLGDDKVYVTASLGISVFPQHGNTPGKLINYAETAMYRAKARSGNGIELFEPQMGTLALRRLKLENALRAALERGENKLSLHYQPALNLHTHKLDYVEALLRWETPELGAINPAEFVAIAEESGLMPMLGRWVLHTAIHQAAQWRNQGRRPLLMAVNLSASQFACDSLVDDIRRALVDSGLPAECLGLEITESAIMSDIEYGRRVLEQIGELGITLMIDDFGTGHSSLSRLRELPVDTVKIDRSFIQDIDNSSGEQAGKMIDAILNMAHGQKLKVIAEGVETEHQKRYLIDRGCDHVQGYLISAAQPAAVLTRRLPQGEALPAE